MKAIERHTIERATSSLPDRLITHLRVWLKTLTHSEFEESNQQAALQFGSVRMAR
jgi:hypothetical protein